MFRNAIILLCVIYCARSELEKLCETNNVNNKCDCGYNKLRYVVNCARNNLKNIPDIKQLPNNLDNLDISHNKITTLTFDEADFESQSLKWLKASYNEITTISKEFLDSIPNLEHLDVSNNKITRLDNNLFTGVPSLHYLDIGFNEINVLPNAIFLPLNKLKTLDLSYNDFQQQFMEFKSIFNSSLGLQNGLTHLKLNYVNISNLPNTFFENSSMTHISLADNALDNIPHFPDTVEFLELSGNYFKSLDVHHLNYANLKTLKLNRLSKLQKIENYAFYNLQSLESLSLEHCARLGTFNDLAFGVLLKDETWKLKKISLVGNGLQQLNETYFKLFNKVDEVNLANNPWKCDCSVIWFHLISEKITNKENMRCVSPPRMRNRNVMDLTEKELPKCVLGSGWRNQKILTSIISVLIVVLLVLILYLIYLGPFNKNGSKKFVGTESPYSDRLVVSDM